MEVRGARGRRFGVILLTLLVIAATSCDEDDGRPRERRDKPTRSAPAEKDEPSSPATEEELPALTTPRFVTPSGNIHCESFPTSLICVTDYRLKPEPSAKFCPVDWIGLFIQVGEHAGPACSGDPGISRDPATELAYEQTWELNGTTCLSEEDGLTCRDGSGNGFTVAMAGWSLLGKEAAATAAFPVLRNMVRKQAQVDLPDKVGTVDFPNLRGGDGCGELQEAFVNLLLTDGTPVIYMACYVSGTWHMTDGPLYPD